MAHSSRKPFLEQQRLFSLKTWRKAEKRSTEIEKLGVLLTWFSPFCLQLFRLCHLLISPEENRDVDFDTFSETTLPFLFSTPGKLTERWTDFALKGGNVH
jgi:hypothetical protein